jgi:hypothetical protein
VFFSQPRTLETTQNFGGWNGENPCAPFRQLDSSQSDRLGNAPILRAKVAAAKG